MPPPTLSIELSLEDTFEPTELGVHNELNEINSLLIQTNETTSQAIFKTELQQISYGHLSDKTPAALIVFRSHFHFTSRNRLKRANIRLALADTLEPTNPEKAPRIIKIAPLWQQGKPAEQTTSSTASLGAAVGDPRVALINLRRDVVSERHQVRHAEIRGVIASHHPRKHPKILNRAVWNIEENTVQQVGIPPFFRGAVLVRYEPERAFQMAMQVDVVQGFVNSALEFLRKSGRVKDDPVCFTPGKLHPPDAGSGGDFEKIELEELIELPGPSAILGI
jgi:hypothetical protein